MGRGRPWLLRSGLGRERRDWWALGLILVLAFGVRIAPVLRGGGLLGLHGYDDGVYFAASIAITQGRLPYRDFLLLLPPGQPVALLPFALLGAVLGDPVAFVAARIATMALGACCAVLVAIVAGRHMRIAGIVAGVLYAVWSGAALTDRSTDLHTVQVALLLVTCLVLVAPGRIGVRRAILAGIPIGLATSVQLWQGVSVLVFLWWVVARERPAGAGRWSALKSASAFGLAAVGAFAAVCLPFFLAAPAAMVRYTLVDQVGRLAMRVSAAERLRAMEGIPHTGPVAVLLRSILPGVAIAAIAGAAVVLIIVAAWRLPWTRPWAVLTLAGAAVLLVTPSFFFDYVALIAAPATLVIGSAAGWLAGRHWGAHGHGRLLVVAGGVLTLALAAVAVIPRVGAPIDASALTADVTGATCVSSDHPTLLVVTGALRRNLSRDCPVVLDPSGIIHDTDRTRMAGGRPAPTTRDAPGYQAAMIRYHRASDVMLMVGNGGFTGATRATIRRLLPDCHRDGIVTVCRAPGRR